MQAPRDLRHTTITERGKARTECDVALQWAYDVLAEYINSSGHDVRPTDDDVDAADPTFLAMPTLDGFCEWVHGPGATVTSGAADAGEVKWLPPMALIELFDLCKDRMASSPSYITFFRCYNETWQHCLKFRPKIMQSKCDDCERLKLLRKQATTPERAEAVRAEHLEHVKSTFLDRAVDERIQKAAYDATTTVGGMPLARSVLNIDMDAMEAMKFKCPRNMGAAKMLSNLWRPQQHMIGSIVDGCTDHYWLVPPDVVKNANLSATLAADLLHHTAALLRQKGVPMPQTFRVHSDNAGGEVKNQTFMKFMAYLTHKHFNSAEMSQFRPGHSHGRIDQTFTVLATALNRQTVLETPDDFQRVMEATRGRSATRPMRVVQLGALYDWETFFVPLQLKPRGHVQAPAMKLQNKEACHVFRFIRRDNLHNIPGGLGEAVTPRTIFEEPPAGDDIILVTKHLLGSQSFAQEPLVFCPGSRFRALPAEGPGTISGRMQFSERQQKEFTRTAEAIKETPWKMFKAHKWLTALMAANHNGFSPTWVPPAISWVVSGEHVGAPLPPMPRALPLGTPAPVVMEDVSRRRIKRKRPPSEVLAPAGQRIRASQRDQNLVMPSAEQSVAGAPPPMVSETGAPENVLRPAVPVVRNNPAAPRGRRGALPRVQVVHNPAAPRATPHDITPMSNRKRKSLLRMADEPGLGCSRCRQSPVGCETCKRTRRGWRIVHNREALP